MLLAIDAGNTNIVLGLFSEDELLASWRLHTDPQMTTDEFALAVNNLLHLRGYVLEDIDGEIVASVVPTLIHTFTRFSQRYLEKEPLIVGPGTKTGMPILLDNPKELGADLIVNAIGAMDRYGTPVIVVDFGTATTFSAVSARGEFAGGVIAPGMRMALDGLFQHTAKLPRVEILEPSQVIGRSTVSAMQSGVFFGFIGLTREIILRIKGELSIQASTIATGGLSGLLARHISEIDLVDPLLTLNGLRIVYERNMKR